LSLPAPVPPLVSRKFLGHPPPEVLRQVRNDHDTQHAQPPTSHLPPLRCDVITTRCSHTMPKPRIAARACRQLGKRLQESEIRAEY